VSRPLELEDLYRLPMVSDPQISPDGSRVAFVVTQADREKDTSKSQIWTVASDGSAPARKLTSGDRDSTPRWSPDGRWLAFVSARGDKPKNQVWLLPLDGGEAQALTSEKGGAGGPVWSPDSKRLAFLSAVDDGADIEDPAVKNRPVVTSTMQYKSDGAGLLGTKRMHLFVTKLDGKAKQLTSGDFSAGMPAWSPDGKTLAFASSMHEGRDLDLASHVYVLPAKGGKPKALTSGQTQAAVTTFSPDGKTILYAGALHIGVGHTQLFTVGLKGGSPVGVSGALDRNVMIGGPAYPGALPRYLPDGTILFCARDQGSTHVYQAPSTKLVGDDWSSVSGLTASSDGSRLAYVLSTPETSGEVWVADGDGANPRQLTTFVSEALDDVDLFRPEARQFEAPDGTAVHGWVLRDPKAATPGPMLLDVHGGPHNAWNPHFDGLHLYHQVLASKGWTVLFINPRGSDGYGESFYTGLVKDGWGRADTDDFLTAVDALVDEGVADRSRVALTGYSYGGYTTCWLTATTDRFKSAVAGGVVSNLVSFSGTSDIGVGFASIELGALPWEDPDRLASMSPFTFVDKVTAPTLIIHGERDDRCPIGQAEEWFSALRARGIETELVRYPGGSHLFILNGPPSQRVDWCRRVIEWVEART
jgi:dipeptidyl aminopeptidase/acylaminoacyl peptidase